MKAPRYKPRSFAGSSGAWPARFQVDPAHQRAAGHVVEGSSTGVDNGEIR